MKVSLISTVKNEVSNVDKLMNSIRSQSYPPNEIIIVDAGSNDGTLEKLFEWEKNLNNLKVLIVPQCNRSQGRNIAIDTSNNDVIAVTDFGCSLNDDWLKEITFPIIEKGYDAVAGFYYNGDKNNISMANSFFTHLELSEVTIELFLPSTRSIAFKKSVWQEIGGFNKQFIFGEDTLFSSTIRKNNYKLQFVPSALVEWNAERSIFKMIKKLYYYSKWDGIGKFDNFFYVKMCVLYFFGLVALMFSIQYKNMLFFCIILIVIYFLKNYKQAVKKKLNCMASILAICLKPIYNLVQIIGYLSGKATKL
jgi:glycosyltransferase involved in cell wall biosynthesis